MGWKQLFFQYPELRKVMKIEFSLGGATIFTFPPELLRVGQDEPSTDRSKKAFGPPKVALKSKAIFRPFARL